MTIKNNKRLVEEFFAKLSSDNPSDAFAMIHDDVTWWNAGGDNLAFSGTLTKSAFTQSIDGMSAVFSERLKLFPISMIAEGDQVAVELSGHAIMKDGRKYDNLYHHLLTIKDGQIIAAREYHDTLYAKLVLIDGQVSNSPT